MSKDPMAQGLSVPGPARVVAAHAPAYPDPIRVARGQALRLDGRSDLWDGWRWLWAAAPDGRAGWVPDALVAGPPDAPVAAFDYAATELSVAEGAVVAVLRATHGWAWARDAGGAEGWLPLRRLAPADQAGLAMK